MYVSLVSVVSVVCLPFVRCCRLFVCFVVVLSRFSSVVVVETVETDGICDFLGDGDCVVKITIGNIWRLQQVKVENK